MPKFFIERPIFAWVIAIITMLAGLLAIMKLPVAQYPTVAPPAISISATYPGADAETVQNTVTQVIEQNMNGIDKMVYMSSTSDSAGNMSISLTFEADADPDIAQVQVQNKLQLAMPLLPQEVQQQGITVQKSTSSFLLVAAFISDDKDMTQDDIADYVGSNVKDPLSRVTGVGETQLFGTQYAMRIWLDPDKLVKYNLTTVDVINSIKIQNNQVAAGQLGGTPSVKDQRLNASIIAQTRLNTPEQFQEIMNHIIGRALEVNNEQLSQDVSSIVNDKVVKELEYLMRVKDEKEEERFKQLDELLRSYQKDNKGRAEAAASKIPFFNRKKKFGRNGKKL